MHGRFSISEFGSRSAISVSSMASQPANSGREGNQKCSLRSIVASVYRAIDFDYPSGMPGSVAVLDSDGFGLEAIGLQRLLQQILSSLCADGTNSHRNVRIQRRLFQVVSLAETLSRSIPHANCGINTNSPYTLTAPSPGWSFTSTPSVNPLVAAEC
jgi:hypothetical protein